MFKKVNPKENFPKMEEKILDFWKENKIFDKSLKLREKADRFVFYEGPPTANGKPGIHHVLARAFKDIIPRYKTMKGYFVERKAGWDTHGLPVELEVEKKLEISGKKDIENEKKCGVKKFNKECKESVWKYKKEWEEMTQRIGFWLDLDHPYITYDNNYIETLWWIIKQIDKKGLLYGSIRKDKELIGEGYKIVPYCYRCGTALSSHELAQGYKETRDPSIYIKFKLKDEKDTYLLVWTTTPWTLPANIALAVHPNKKYIKIEQKGEKFILAKDRQEILEGKFKIIDEFLGKDLNRKEYEPLFPEVSKNVKYLFGSGKGEFHFVVTTADFISMDEGTGIVHIDPANGEDDLELWNKKKNELGPLLRVIDDDGKAKAGPGKGKFFFESNEDVIKKLKDKDLLYKSEEIVHDYPYCWRCDTKLFYDARISWFIRMSDPRIKKALIDNNKKIKWIPVYIKEGRFGEWLSESKDWAISRQRYWGTPLPIWVCENCSYKGKDKDYIKKKVIGSVEELEKLSGKKPSDLHKPFMDEITFKCDKCRGEMKRIPEVADCWFDSGSMPFAQWHYPFENKDRIDKNLNYPADYISEAIDQTRGWFYTLLAVSTLLDKGTSYKNVICLGHVLDAKGQKMSKSRGNVVDPKGIIDKYGVDSLRWLFYTMNRPGDSKRFDKRMIEEVTRKLILILWNTYSFFVTYANIDNFKPRKNSLKPENILDRWILSQFNQLVNEVDNALENYDIFSARKITDFINALSTWYVRRSRRRFWKSENDKDKIQAYQTLYTVLLELTKLLAPFMPFITEEIYQNLKQVSDPASIHLCDFPKANQKLINKELVDKMEKVRQIVELGLGARSDAHIKVRQPLQYIRYQAKKLDKDFEGIVAEELNVKEVKHTEKIRDQEGRVIKEDCGIKVALNIEITDELKQEGIAREIVRFIQSMRKKADYNVEDRINVFYQTESVQIKKVFEKFGDYIAKETLSKSLKSVAEPLGSEDIDLGKEMQVEGEKVWVGVKR